MSRAGTAPSELDAMQAARRRAIHLTNVTGLANRKHYEIAFGPLAREMRDSICGEVPFAVAVRDAGVPVEAIMEVGTYPPDAEVPPHVQRDLVDIEEVVDATGTQVLEMREQGGPEAERFTVHGRQRYATLMIAFGDTLGTLVRNLAWTREGDVWKISQFAQEQAALHGWTRANYERVQADFPNLLPAPNSDEIEKLTAGRRPEGPPGDGQRTPWISYAEMADFITR